MNEGRKFLIFLLPLGNRNYNINYNYNYIYNNIFIYAHAREELFDILQHF